MPENLYEFRRNGENEDTICILIQKKLTKVFITYINKKIFYLDSKIKQSIYVRKKAFLVIQLLHQQQSNLVNF